MHLRSRASHKFPRHFVLFFPGEQKYTLTIVHTAHSGYVIRAHTHFCNTTPIGRRTSRLLLKEPTLGGGGGDPRRPGGGSRISKR